MPQIVAFETDAYYFDSFAPWSLTDGMVLRVQPLIKIKKEFKIVCPGCHKEVLPSDPHIQLLAHGDMRIVSDSPATAVAMAQRCQFHNEKCLRNWLRDTAKATA